MTSQSIRPRTLARRRISVAALVPLLLVASACGGDQDRPNRPPITRPLDATAFRDRACELLPAADATRLGYPARGGDDKRYREGYKAGDLPYMYSCYRLPPESLYLIIDLYVDEDRLAAEYAVSELVTMTATNEPVFEAISIADQPAAVLGRSHKQPETSRDPCDVVVGLTDTQSLRVSAGTKEVDRIRDPNTGGRSCQLAIAVADAIVQNLLRQR